MKYLHLYKRNMCLNPRRKPDQRLHPVHHSWPQLPRATPTGTDAVLLVFDLPPDLLNLLFLSTESLVFNLTTFSFLSSDVLFVFVRLRYKDLTVPTLGDKSKLSAEEKCRCVLRQTKLQGWQVCAFFRLPIANKRFCQMT